MQYKLHRVGGRIRTYASQSCSLLPFQLGYADIKQSALIISI